MPLTPLESQQLVNLIHKMSADDGDNLFCLQVLVRTTPSASQSAVLGSVLVNDVAEDVLLSALDGLSIETKSAVVVALTP